MASTRERAMGLSQEARSLSRVIRYQGRPEGVLFGMLADLADVVAESMDEPLLIVKGSTVRESDVERAAGAFTYDRIRSKVAGIIYDESEASSKPGSASLAGLSDAEWTADLILKSLTERDLSDLEDRLHDEHEEN